MDRAMPERHLLEAEMHITEGEHHLVRQREIVAELANDGRDLKSAQALLIQFETMLANHVADRDRIQAELAALGSSPSAVKREVGIANHELERS